MRKILLFFIFISLYIRVDSQTIKGTIINQSTDSVIYMATVYFNGTSVGTYSDKNGHFELDISKFKPMPITISALGYYSITLSAYSPDKLQDVFLTPKVFELKEVVIGPGKKAYDNSRVRNLKIFKNEFLGESVNSYECEIINEDDLIFDSANGILKAFASKPLIVRNNNLSYTITYYLDKFELNETQKSLIILGNVIFRDDSQSADQSQKQKIDKERKKAFYGSRLHFFRSLWKDDIKAAGFAIKSLGNKELKYDSFVLQSDSIRNGTDLKFLKDSGDLIITYYPKYARTWIKLLKQKVSFDKFGYFDPSGINWGGKMSGDRIADLLPYDYSDEGQSSLNQNLNDSLPVIEKVYLHSDRVYYYPGDDIWFKAYLIDASDRLLTDHSNNLHVELISSDSKILNSSVIRLEDGLGNGDFKLADNVPSGKYRIRAYTNYMRNFGDQLFYDKEIFIVGSSEKNNESDKNQKYVNNKIELNFFPEGGSLVDNVYSVVAFKAVDATGKSCNVSGKVFSTNGDLVTTFKSTHLGMGSFILKPVAGLTYYAELEDSDRPENKFTIPRSFDKGLVLSASVNQKNEILITSKTNPQTLRLLLNNDLVLTVSVRKVVIKRLSFKIESLTNILSLSTDDFPDGILMLTLSTMVNLPLCEKLIFFQRDNNLKISIQSDKDIYKKREPVSIKLSVSGDSIKQHQAFLSLSAAESSLTDNASKYPSNIASWFLLESDIRGPVEEPSYYFDQSNPNRLKDLDLLLRTQGWRDFAWKYKKSFFKVEDGFLISGKLRRNLADKPIPNSKVNIGIFADNNTYTTTILTDSVGTFRLNKIDFNGEARLIVSGVGKKEHLQGLLILDSLKYLPAEVPSFSQIPIMIQKDDLDTLKKHYEISESIRKKYKLSDTINLGEVRIIASKPKDQQALKVESSRASYGTPDDELIITNQLESFRNVVEILKGRVAGVAVTGNYPEYQIRIRGTHTITGNALPLVLVDGFKRSFDDLINFPLYFIDRVDVLKSGGATASFGMEGANGVISIITRTGDRLTTYQPVNNSVNVKFYGYNAPRIFYSPLHNPKIESEYNPDLRTTLFWKPDISLKTGKDLLLKYFNTDNSSKICLVIEGITTNGIPIFEKINYEVR